MGFIIFGMTSTELNWYLALGIIFRERLAAIKNWNILAILIMKKSNPVAPGKPSSY